MIPELLVIIPSRGRPRSIERLLAAWDATANGVGALRVCLDDDDPTVGDYLALLDPDQVTVAPRDGFAPRLTTEAVQAAPHWLALASWGDDHVPRTLGWDSALMEALTDLGTGFAYGDDRIQGERLPTACAMTSDIVQTLGWMTPPGFAHMYVDDVWRDLGQAIDRIRYLPDVVIEHRHPLVLGLPADQLVIDANTEQSIAADRAVYEEWKDRDMPGCVEKLRGIL